MSESFDAYHKWLGIPPEDQPPDHYRLLGIKRFEGDADVISHAADQRMAHVRSLQTGQHAKLSQRLLNEISNARICLLNAEQKAQYDTELAARLKPKKKLAKAKPLPKAKPVAPAPADIAFSAEAPSTLPVHARARRKSSPVIVVTLAVGVIAIVAVVGIVFALRSGNQPSRETTQAEQRHSDQTDTGKSQPAEPATAVSPDASAVEPVDTARPISAADTDVEAAVPPSDPTTNPPSIDRTEPQPAVEPPKPSPPEVAGVEPPATTETADARLPIPDEAAQRAALQLVRDVFEADSKNAKTAEEKSAVAERMIQAAADTMDDPATRFVLLRVARDMAAAAGNVELAGRAVERLAAHHQVDSIEMKIQTLTKAGEAIQDVEARKAFVASAGEVIDEALAVDDFDLAVPFAESVLTLARRTGDIDLIKDAVARGREIEGLAKQYEPVRTALAVLEANPSDAAANLVIGRYRCLVKGDWEGGLPYLALSGDAGLRAVAEQELMLPTTAEDQAKLGDAWWDLAEQEDDDAKDRLQQRAAYWYRLSAPELAGLTKTKVEQRIADVDRRLQQELAEAGPKTSGAREKPEKLEVVYLDDIQEVDFRVYGNLGKHGIHLYGTRPIPIRINGQPVKHSLLVCAPSNSTGYVNYKLDGKGKAFAASVAFMDDESIPQCACIFSVVADGKELWRSQPVQKRGIVQSCELNVSGVDMLQLRVEATGFNRNTHPVWLNPRLGMPKEERQAAAPRSSKKLHPVLGYELKEHAADAIKGGDHYYFTFVTRGISWSAAQQRCKDLGGYLACVETEAEQQFLVKVSRGQEAWIGGRMTVGNRWTWINGAPANYSNWNPGQPDGRGKGGMPEDCLMMMSKHGKWNDSIEARGLNVFICEWEF